MSERSTKKPSGDVLDRNVEQLLTRAHEPPRMRMAARARILDALSDKVSNDAAAALPQSRWWSGRPLLLAGGAVACVGIALLAVQMRGTAPGSGSHSNQAPEAKRVALADGSELILDHGARVQVLGDRQVRVLEGKVMLDVVPGKGRFVVETAQGRMIVLGTRFVVSASATNSWAAVVRGKVRIQNNAGAALLRAGERGELREGARPTRRPAPRLTHLSSFARLVRRRAERPGPGAARKGTLLARDPEGRWQQQEFPLPMRRLDIDVHVENQIARVAIDQTFFNTKKRQLEGVYHFPLPPGAAISRQAMYVNGKLMESAIVERRRGRQIYEEIVYTRRDPALMEWMAGNIFKVRIFPLPARQEKRILLAYTQPLERLYDDYQLNVPLPELDAPVDRVRYKVRLAGCASCQVSSSSHALKVRRSGNDALVSFERSSYEIGDDFLLTIRDPSGKPRVATHAAGEKRYWMARVRPTLDGAGAEHQRRRWVVLHDTSASRSALERKAQAFVIDHLLREIDEDDQIQILAFDTTVRRKWNAFERVADIDRRAVATFLSEQSRDGVGSTDLEKVLKQALTLLEGASDDAAPHILYLGDGIVTGGEGEAAALRKMVANKATVVTVAVGDRMDASVLRGLAEASGGMFTVMNPGDDLGWRAFDLVAALNTRRVLDLGARLLDAEGRALEGSSFYTSSQQLSDGEELSLVARLGARTPAAVELHGTVSGKPWTQRIALPAPVSGGDAGYLPRLWAQRRIDDLIARGKKEHKADITKLGMEHFLITPFTSLLVLENDAMYARYKVSRDGKKRWAEYPAPETIRVVRDQLAPKNVVGADDGKVLMRTPTRLFYDYSQRFRTVTRNTGRFDFAGPVGGSGTGAGFGGGGVLDSGVMLRGEHSLRVVTDETVSATRQPIGGPAKPAEDPDTSNADSNLDRGRRGAEVTTFGTRLGGLEKSGRLSDVRQGLVEAEGRANRQQRSIDGLGYFGLGRGLIPGDDFKSQLVVGIPAASAGGGMNRGWADSSYYYSYQLSPVAFHYSRDYRLDDLSEWVPGLFAIPFDISRANAEASSKKSGSVTDMARVLIARARARQLSGRFRSDDGRTIDVSSAGHFQISRELPSGLRERIVYDGAQLVHDYAELGLSTTRTVGETEAFLYGQFLPFTLPSVKALGRWYRVSNNGNTLVLSPRKGSGADVEIALDSELRVTQIRSRKGKDVSVILRVGYVDDRIVLRKGGARTVVTRVGAAQAIGNFDPLSSTTVQMPLRQPLHWSTEAGKHTAGSTEWRHAQRQLLASFTAVRRPADQRKVLDAIRSHAALTRGELALASRVAQVIPSAKELEALVGHLGRDSVASYVRAAHGFARKRELAGFDRLATNSKNTLVGMLSSYRGLLSVIEQRVSRTDAERRFRDFADQYTHHALVYVAANAYNSRWGHQNPLEASRLWERVGGHGRIGAAARFQAIRSLYNARKYDAAADRIMTMLGKAPGDLYIDHTTRAVFHSSSRGQAGWRMFWNQFRQKVMAQGDVHGLMAFLRVSQRLNEKADLDRVVARLTQAEIDSPVIAAGVADLLRDVGRLDSALAVLSPWLAKTKPLPGMLARASYIAERQGRSAEAIAYLQRMMKSYENQRMDLAGLRRDFARLVKLDTRLAQTTRDATRDGAIEAALVAVARWRRVDPDNAQIDQLAASLLYSVARPDEAWRYLSTVIERHPMEGRSYQTVADVLEREGRVAQAIPLWERAAEVDPTNPTWLMRHAQSLAAAGNKQQARAVLDKVKEGTWHSRFRNVVNQAGRLRGSMDALQTR